MQRNSKQISTFVILGITNIKQIFLNKKTFTHFFNNFIQYLSNSLYFHTKLLFLRLI